MATAAIGVERRGGAVAAGGGRAARTRRGVLFRQAALLSALALLLRLPSFTRPFWSPDEGYLATEAAMLRGGGRLYADVVDRKPPLLPWLYEGCSALAGPHGLGLVRLLAAAALALTAVLTARLAARWYGARAALPAGVLTVAAAAALPAPDAMAATFEIFMLPATAAALYLGARHRYFAAGLAVAAAALTKQVGLAPLLPLAVQILAGRRRLRAGAALAAGTLLPLLACALLLGPHRFAFWVYFSSGSYATSPPGAGTMLARGGAGLGCLLSAFAGCALLLPLLPRRPRPGRRRRTGTAADRTAALWLLASAAGAAAGWHFYGHYFLQLAPPLALCALRLVDAACRPGTGGPPALRRRVARLGRSGTAAAVAAVALAVAAGWSGAALLARPPGLGKATAVAAAVDAHSAPGERLFQWGMHPEVYRLAERPPASRYLTAGLLTNFSGGGDPLRVGPQYAVPGSWPTLRRELAKTPPCLVVDDSAGTPYRLAGYPELRTLLARGYRQVAAADGARIYRRTRC